MYRVQAYIDSGVVQKVPKLIGESPSGKALDFDSSIRRFDPYLPSQFIQMSYFSEEWLPGVMLVKGALAPFFGFSFKLPE